MDMGALPGLGLVLSQSATAAHRPQSSSASRLTAGAAGFLNLSQSLVRPERGAQPL
jgi:hypothetical protein